MKMIRLISTILVLVGAVNWGLVGIANFSLVAALLGHSMVLTRLVYTAVGLAGLFEIWELTGKHWNPTGSHPMTTT
jgi:uncharacterized protein